MTIRLSAWLFLLAWAATLADQLGELRAAGSVAGVAIALFLALEFSRQRRAIRIVSFALVLGGMAAVAMSADPVAALEAGWRRGAAYAAFFLALGLIVLFYAMMIWKLLMDLKTIPFQPLLLHLKQVQ